MQNGKEVVDFYRVGAYFDLVLMYMEMPIMDGPTISCLIIYTDVKNIWLYIDLPMF